MPPRVPGALYPCTYVHFALMVLTNVLGSQGFVIRIGCLLTTAELATLNSKAQALCLAHLHTSWHNGSGSRSYPGPLH